MNNKQIKLGAVIAYFALAINITLTIFYTPWMVSNIGKSNYGLYTLAISLIGVFMLDFGLSSATARFIAKYRAENNEQMVGKFIGAVFKLYLLIDAVILIVLVVIYFFIPAIYVGLNPDETEIFRQVYIIISVFNLLAFPMTPLSGILNAYEQFVSMKVCDLLNKIMSVLFAVLSIIFLKELIYIVLANTVANMITIIIRIIILKRKVKVKISLFTDDRGIYKEIFSFSAWTTVTSIAQRLTCNLAPSVLAITMGSVAVAYFSPASAIGGYYFSIAAAINGFFLPEISRIVSARQDERLLKLMVRVGRYQSAVLGLIFAGFFCVGDDFMTLWMGPEFISSYYCTILIMLPQFFECSQQIGNTAIIVKNYVKEQSIVMIITSIIGLILEYIVSKSFGAIGCCAVLSIVGLCNVFGYNLIHKRKIGINIKKFYKDCYATMLLPIIITCVFARLIVTSIGVCSVPWLIIKAAITGVIYLSSVWLVGLKQSERAAIAGKVKIKFGK